ncbi:MAG: hypothetical protein CME84_10110 [Henriciella sp.]|jgi:hypothetical protein|uniref:hypothetical protein n=1 Tax=Henriciella sp. TaxID=1968823 RepID=UPI000C0DA915|nr:hypothetical protein [Henriciella sp.]MAN74425.1 hypothetical protein [Henriciella sp.]MBF35190.1 hypothetical protein [Hyphomonadaceae bacterium]PHR75502.1 MAG: hypothetical protein COA64_11970 [Henriciella sp.]|tara:strand:- start:786 stop:1184 length:399 start_codon:yes stop_codon:yes gene_type:complete
MDIAKLRIIAGAGAVFFGFAGVTTLTIAAVIALIPVIGLLWATVCVASLFLFVACICTLVFLKPGKSTEEELDQFESATADMLAELPFDMIQSLVEKRPLAAASIALAAGYFVVSNPAQASKGLQKLIDELI